MPSPPPIEPPNDYGLPIVSPSGERGSRLRDVVERIDRARSLREEYRSIRLRAEELAQRVPRPQPFGDSGQDDHLSVPRTRFVTRDNTPFRRSPEPMSAADRPDSRSGAITGRSNLPTPPLEQSEDLDSLFVPERTDMRRPRTLRPTHPLSNSWRPESPINGLGDRNRSPTPADGWEIMQTTITPDVALPSADSSFTSAAASQSFTSSDTALTEPDREPLTRMRSVFNRDSDSDSDANDVEEVDDIMRDVDERDATAQYASDMYFHEIRSEEGLSRILHHRRAHAAEGNKFALANEGEEIELGFRLIDEALNSDEGRRRVFDISQRPPRDARSFEDWIFSSRRDRRPRRAASTDDDQPCPQIDRRTTAEDAAREASAHVHNYFRRFTADSLADSHRASTEARQTSPPPQYEPLASQPVVETLVSRDPPEPHPVSPPSARSQTEMGDLLLSGDEQDLNAVRRVVERLAQRDDVPDEWWMSMGLNLSRTRVRSRSPTGEIRRPENASSIADGAYSGVHARSPRAARERREGVQRGGTGSRL